MLLEGNTRIGLQGGRHLQNCQPTGFDDVIRRICLRPVNVIETGGVALLIDLEQQIPDRFQRRRLQQAVQ